MHLYQTKKSYSRNLPHCLFDMPDFFTKSILLVTHGYYISLLRIQFYSHRDNYHLCVNNRRCRHHMESYNPVHTPLSYTLEKRIKRSFILKFFVCVQKTTATCFYWFLQFTVIIEKSRFYSVAVLYNIIYIYLSKQLK